MGSCKRHAGTWSSRSATWFLAAPVTGRLRQETQHSGPAPALEKANPGMARQASRAPRPLAEVHFGTSGRRAGRALGSDRCGSTTWTAWALRPLVAAATTGEKTRGP